jgi:glycosyltransferase involved in cell wall biosynthesis
MSRAEAKLSIGFVLDSLAGGGAEKIMVELAARLSQLGHAPTVIVGNAAGPWRALVPPDLRILDLEASGKFAYLRRLVAALRRERVDVVLVTGLPSIIFTLSAKALGLISSAIVIRERNTTSRELAASRYRLFITPLARLLYRHANRIVCLCQDARADFLRTIPLDPTRVAAIYNAVSPDPPADVITPPDHPFFQMRDAPVVVAAGRLEQQKDFLTLLRAFRSARARRALRLVILGEGHEREALEKFAAESGFADDISLPGFRLDIARYLHHADLFVLSSRYEGLPNALLQALSSGCRVVSTDCPSGPREILDDGKYGRLVTIGDAPALAEAMLASLDEPRPVLDPAFAERFSPEHMARAYLQVLTAAAAEIGAAMPKPSLEGEAI